MLKTLTLACLALLFACSSPVSPALPVQTPVTSNSPVKSTYGGDQWVWVGFRIENDTSIAIPYYSTIQGCDNGQHDPFTPNNGETAANDMTWFLSPFGGCLFGPGDGFVQFVVGGLGQNCILDIQEGPQSYAQWFSLTKGNCYLEPNQGSRPETLVYVP